MSALIEAYVTNLGKYAEYGVEAGETLKFPATTEEVQALLKRIGVDGVRYEEIFITAFDGDVLGNSIVQHEEGKHDDVRWHFCVESHPGLTDLFVHQMRQAWQRLGLFESQSCLPEDDGEIDY